MWKFGAATARIQYQPLNKVDRGPVTVGVETGGEVIVLLGIVVGVVVVGLTVEVVGVAVVGLTVG